MENQELNQKSEETQSNRVAKIPVAIPLLEHMLPAGTQIQGFEWNEAYHTINLIVSHPSFEPLNVGDMIPHKMLKVYKESHENHSWISKVEYAS